MSDALFYANALEVSDKNPALINVNNRAAAELRRLHAENEALKAELLEQARVNGMGSDREARLMALNTELVEALRSMLYDDDQDEATNKARAALAKAEENK